MGAFFIGAGRRWYRPAFLLLLWPLAATASDCDRSPAATPATVAAIYDGDTLRLADERHARLIGINTPEIGRGDTAEEPLAPEAAALLRRLTPPGTEVWLEYDEERKDRYGRVLAHAFLADGTNVQARLLDSGLAAALVVPPNLRHLSCYREAERAARAADRGIWRHPYYAPVAAERLTKRLTGFRRVSGRIGKTFHRSRTTTLVLDGRLAVRIEDRDRKYFTDTDFERWLGRRVIVRGYVTSRSGRLRMQLRHADSLEFID